MKKRIIFSFTYCREGELIKIARRILDSIKQSTQFPNAGPLVELIEKALLEYIAALSAAGGRDRVLVSIKDDKKAILLELLMELANYVTQIAKGDKTLLLASGFDINADKSASQKIAPALLVELDKPGQITIRIKRVGRARVYVHQYTTDPITSQSNWTSEHSKNAKHTFTGLESGAKLWLRVIVVNQKGESIYWEPVSRIVQ